MKNEYRSARSVALYCLLFVGLNILLFYIFAVDSVLASMIIKPLQSLTPAGGMTVLFIAQEILLIAILLLALGYRKPKAGLSYWKEYFLERRQWRWWWLAVKRVGGGIFVYFLISVILAILVFELGVPIPGMYGEQMVMSMLEELPLLNPTDYLRVLITTVILWPVVEELIYRWFITDVLMRKWWIRWVVWWAAIFAVGHFERGVVLNLFLLAMFMWYIYWKTESMWYSLLFHMLINGMAVVAMFYARLYPELVVSLL